MLGRDTILHAFDAMGKRISDARWIDIFIVGGAAGVLTGELPSAWTTADVDLIHCHLPADSEEILNAAAAITRELGLPPGMDE